jgi:hypothetical protein
MGAAWVRRGVCELALSEAVFFLWTSSIVLILLTAYDISEAGFRNVEDDGQSLKGQYNFTNSFFLLLLRLPIFHLPLLQNVALIQTHQLYRSSSHVVLRVAAAMSVMQPTFSVGHVEKACLC